MHIISMRARPHVLWQLCRYGRGLRQGPPCTNASRDRLWWGRLVGGRGEVDGRVQSRFRGALCGTHAWRLMLLSAIGAVACMHVDACDRATHVHVITLPRTAPVWTSPLLRRHTDPEDLLQAAQV